MPASHFLEFLRYTTTHLSISEAESEGEGGGMKGELSIEIPIWKMFGVYSAFPLIMMIIRPFVRLRMELMARSRIEYTYVCLKSEIIPPLIPEWEIGNIIIVNESIFPYSEK